MKHRINVFLGVIFLMLATMSLCGCENGDDGGLDGGALSPGDWIRYSDRGGESSLTVEKTNSGYDWTLGDGSIFHMTVNGNIIYGERDNPVFWSSISGNIIDSQTVECEHSLLQHSTGSGVTEYFIARKKQ